MRWIMLECLHTHIRNDAAAGEILQYVITDYYQTRSKNNRAIPIELIDESICYDVRGYIELLTETCNSVTEPFGLKLTLPPIPVSSL